MPRLGSRVRVSFSAHERKINAQVAELVDAHVSGACVERRAGSTPVLGTQSRMSYWNFLFTDTMERWRNGRRATLRW